MTNLKNKMFTKQPKSIQEVMDIIEEEQWDLGFTHTITNLPEFDNQTHDLEDEMKVIHQRIKNS